jgi:hypothetical protein
MDRRVPLAPVELQGPAFGERAHSFKASMTRGSVDCPVLAKAANECHPSRRVHRDECPLRCSLSQTQESSSTMGWGKWLERDT